MYNPYDFEKYPKRKNPRLKDHDYASENVYFVTICTHEKRCIFWNNGTQNELGNIAEQGIRQINQHYSDIDVRKYVVMPNHVHLIINVHEGKIRLDQAIGTYKAFVSRFIHRDFPEMIVWQKSFHDHIIRNEEEYQKIWLYIEANPMNWGKDCFYDKM